MQFNERQFLVLQNYNYSMRNDSKTNDLMPWQTFQAWDSPFSSHKTFLVPSPQKINQLTIHSRADTKNKRFFRTKRSTSCTQASQKNYLQPKKKVNKLKQKINFLNAQLEQVAYASIMKNWTEKTVNTCPIKVTKVYNEIVEDRKNALKKVNYEKEIWKKIGGGGGGGGLQNFTNQQINTKNIRKDNLKVSFSQFLEMRKSKKSKINVNRKTVTEAIDIYPAIHVKIPSILGYFNKINCCNQNQVQSKHKSSKNVKARGKLIISTLKRSIQNNKMFQQFQLNKSKCEDLKAFSLSNSD